MGRFARVVVPACPHHVTHRGNLKASIFFSDHDRNLYLRILADQCRRHEAAVLAWCLMENHVHLVLRPEREDSLSKAIGRTEVEYARWLHTSQRQVGHLWQDRYYSCPLEGSHLWDALRYVELNPVRAGIVERPEDWKWSSARAHLTGVDDTGLLDMEWWSSHFSPKSWAEFLDLKARESELPHRIRTATQTGRPYCREECLRQIEEALGRNLHPGKRRR